MFSTPSEESLRQVEIALEQGRQTARFQGIVYLFWGLIFAKLFLVEYAMQVYQVPLNSALYIWSLTLAMAALCTVVYALLSRERINLRPLTGQWVAQLWLGCFTAMAVVAAAGLLLQSINPYAIPGLCALLLGLGFFLHSVLNRRLLFRGIAVGWWLGSLFLLLDPSPRALLVMGLLLLGLHVIPFAILHFLPPKTAASPASPA